MLLLAIRLVSVDHSDSLKLTKTRLSKELQISSSTFTKYFVKTDHPEKPKGYNINGRTVYSEKEINNFLINHIIPVYKHTILLEAEPTMKVTSPQNKHYTLQNKHNTKILTITDLK